MVMPHVRWGWLRVIITESQESPLNRGVAWHRFNFIKFVIILKPPSFLERQKIGTQWCVLLISRCVKGLKAP
jgi:hypothetical protein